MDKKAKKEPGIKEWAIILAAGALLLLLSVPDLFQKEKKSTETSGAVIKEQAATKEDYAKEMEHKLEELLLEMEGITSAKVVITLKSTKEKIILQDVTESSEHLNEEDGAGGVRSSQKATKERTTVSSGEEPYLTKELTPQVEGVVAVISGAKPEWVLSITEAVQALFDIPAHKVKVINY